MRAFGDSLIGMDRFDRSIIFSDKKHRRADVLEYLEGGNL